ncbi:hypothetical protein SJAV_26100 [Sulfurisphaera javensis]|uniref:Uncharacterized protein n=1 Tax=Sulfurisphaera javensis TaxID=2049879 RepID=A0AAT9GVI0_9CREN
MDSELVWGGFANGACANFTSMTSYLAMYYYNDGNWIAFHKLYTYGNDTGESACDLVTKSVNKYALVTIGSISPKTVTINPPSPALTFVNITSTYPIYVNNTLTKSFVSYISYPLIIKVNGKTITVTPNDRPIGIVINGSKINYHYYINVVFPFAINASINGHESVFHSGWYKNGTIISIDLNKYYYLNNETRYEVVSNLNSVIIVNSSYVFNPETIKQYLVVVKSPYLVKINGIITNSAWVNDFSTVKIDVSLPFYLTGYLNGTCMINIGQHLTVTEPLYETLVTSINVFLISVLAILGIFSSVGVLTYRSWRKYKEIQKMFEQVQLGVINNGLVQLLINSKTDGMVIGFRLFGLLVPLMYPIRVGVNNISFLFPYVFYYPNMVYEGYLIIYAKGKLVKVKVRVVGQYYLR